MAQFDSKSFNSQAFGYMVERVPNLKMSELKKSRALGGNPDIRAALGTQDGTGYARLAMRGLLAGAAVNYDGKTDIAAASTKTYERGVVVVGRAQAWVEKDFSYDITGGLDFMANVAAQVAEYKDTLDQETLLRVLEGIFSMTDEMGRQFVQAHTYDVSSVGDGKAGPTTLNTAVNKACGANKKKFSLVFMHSDISTNLENLNLLEHLKYTDKDGVTRDLELGTWNGKLVVIDDSMPVLLNDAVYAKSADTAVVPGKTYFSRTGSAGAYSFTPVPAPLLAGLADYFEITDPGDPCYVTYVLGSGAIAFEDLGAKVTLEMARDPKINGGEDTLYMRQRKVFAPFGLSYERKRQASLSPTDLELADGDNWMIVNSGESDETQRSFLDHKAIPIARILSKG